MKIFLTVTEIWSVQECLKKKNNQRGMTWKVREGEQSLLYVTHRHVLIHIPLKLYEDIPYGYGVMSRTKILEKIIKGA